MSSGGRHSTGLAHANHALVGIGIIVLLAICAGTASLIVTRRSAAIEDSWRATTDLAQVLAEQTSRSMQTVDLTLREIAANLTSMASQTGEPLADVLRSPPAFRLLVDQVKGLPQVATLSIIGSDGILANGSRGYPAPQMDLADRDYFRHFPGNDDHAVFVSTPVHSRSSGAWVMYVGRRINGPHGEFAGVIIASITLSYLQDFYRAAMPADDSVTMLRRDGTILVHFPYDEAEIGAKLPEEAPWYHLVDQSGGSYRSPGYLDGVVTWESVRPLRDFPLVVDVASTEDAALAAWRHEAMWLMAIGAAAAAGAIFLLWVFDAQVRRLTRSEASLARQNTELENSRLHFDAALDNMSQGLTFFDGNERLIVCNRRYREIYRLTPEQTRPGTPLADIIAARQANGSVASITQTEYLERRRRLAASGKPFEIVDELRDGRVVLLRFQPLAKGGWVATQEDITERRRAESTLAFLARHDALTRLPNRVLFRERLDQALAATEPHARCALLLLDLDGFKAVNDTLGHPVGDALLQAVAGRLLSVVRKADTIARLGGDEFAIVQVGLDCPEQVAALAERAIASIAEPFDIDGRRVLVGASIGASMAPSDGTSHDALLRHADIALYFSKAEGRGTFRLFEPTMEARVRGRRGLELDLRDALASNAFELHYQPVVDLQSGRPVGFESLIRWNHPTRGVVGPGEFIPIAEDTGLIVAIGKWVLQRACIEATQWPDDIGIAVNLSAVQFRDDQLPDTVAAALAESGLAPGRLELEITESVLLQNSDDRLGKLRALRALGVRIALDDFGTGYSSLSYLRSFRFDKLKIDRSFIVDLAANQDARVIVSTIVGLGVGLGMTVTAEGVESPDQLSALRLEGCAQVQGDLFSPPLSADAALDWLRARTPRAPSHAEPPRNKPSPASRERVG